MDIIAASNANYADFQKQQTLADSLQTKLNSTGTAKDDEELKKACAEFESYFVNLMFKEMRKTVSKDGSFIKENQAERIFTDMMDEEMGKSIANSSNGIGLAKSLYEQMKNSAQGISYSEYNSKTEENAE